MLLVEGKTFGKIDAIVVAKPPNKNNEEYTNPVMCFVCFFMLNKPNNPTKVSRGKIQRKGCSIKL